jgi:pyrroline-5-carboxylate reductase
MNEKKVGIIGYGSMGSMLLNGFRKSSDDTKLFVSTRSKDGLKDLEKTGIMVSASNAELVKECDIVFICVKPVEVKDVLDEVKDQLSQNKHIISIAGSVNISHIEKYHSGKISRVLPTLISEVGEGITLVCHNDMVMQEDSEILEILLGRFSTVKTIPENEFGIISILTSCAPGLIAALFDIYVKSLLNKTSLDEGEITGMMKKTLYGTAKLFIEKNMSFEETITRVATKGGSTEVGSAVIKEHLPEIFNLMITKMIERHISRDQIINGQFE